MKKHLFLLLAALPLFAAAQQPADWANYGRYAEANARLEKAPEVVFMGNSITDGWDDAHPEFFSDNNYACRGISGQVTSQMLCRFRADVINLHPKAVVILAGTNDLALNNGPIAMEHIVENIVSMAELARAAGIKPILCSVLPAGKYPWRPEVEDVAGKIRTLNAQIKAWADANGVRWVDYHAAMDAGDGSMRSELTRDGVHPTRQGYDVMEQILVPVLDAAK
ncbi:SGNH/GDSL hydrolase family protein [Alistipes sp.]|uniref:SGNH/GDSL hydrolase family protein n=1 Tax=Alistipes sp. TaxID=1872444 RepID=UPI003A8A87DB